MNRVRREIRDLISINDEIQSALLSADRITEDEVILIRQCANELLEKVPAPKQRTKTGEFADGQMMGDGAGDLTALS